MKKVCGLATFVLGTSIFATQVSAQSLTDTAGAITQGWSGTATLGASSASGNSEASSISGDIRLGKTVGRWEHLVFGTVFKGTSTLIIEERDPVTGVVAEDEAGRPLRRVVDGTNSDRIALGYQPKFYWKPRTYFFGILDWETDEPANIDSSTRQIVGIGHNFWKNEEGFLSGELGLGNKVLNQNVGKDIKGAIGYLGLSFVHRFTENASFNTDLRSDFGDTNTFVELGLGLTFKVSTGMALKISHFTRNNSDLSNADKLPGLDSNSDSITSLNLVIDI